MAKITTKKISDPENYNISISANINQKKMLENIEKSIISNLKTKEYDLPLDNLTVSINGDVKRHFHTPMFIIPIIIILITILTFKYADSQKELFTTQKSLISTQNSLQQALLPKPTPVIEQPKAVNKKVSILVLNATYANNLASGLKRTLVQNKFELVSAGNAKKKNNVVTIIYKPEYKFEAQYLQENYIGLSDATLLEADKTISPTKDIVIVLGKSYLSR